jgi:RND family efflux transporter MFP subunit
MTPEQKKTGLGFYATGLIAVAAAGAAVFYFTGNHASHLAQARETVEAEAARGPRVEVFTARPGPTVREVRLLGDAKPFTTTTLFAKVSGYLKSVSVDKGDTVKAGQVLAEIESAELEAQYLSAVADREYKKRLVERARELLQRGIAAQQAADLAETNLRQAEEAVKNFATMRAYQVLRAPFDGTITARFADPGALLQAATTNQTSSLPLLTISDNSKLRVGAYVEQRDAGAIQVGTPADVVDSSNPDRRVAAKISRTAGTLDPRTRTLYVEVDVDNRDNFLLPGSFAYVTIKVPLQSYTQIPVTALLQRNGAQVVGVTTPDGQIKFRPVRLASTDGNFLNISDGIAAGDQVAVNVPASVADGDKVRPVQPRR